MERVPLGIKKIDALLKGGVPEGSCILLSGEPGTGKSLIMQKLVYNHLKKGNSVIYVTTDRTSERLVEEVKDYGMDYFKYVKNGQLKILDTYVGFVRKSEKGFSYADIRDLTEISIKIEKLRRELEGRKFVEVYDVISELFIWNKDKDLVLRFISSVCSSGSNKSIALFFVINEGIEDDRYINSIKSVVDGVLLFGVSEDKRWFKISKMAKTSVSTKKHYFNITEDGKIRIL